MLVMSVLVFVGVYAIGNPIDVLISPDADQQIRATGDRSLRARPAALAAVSALPRQRAAAGDFGRSFVFNMPVLELILSRLPATLELTLAAVLGATLIGVPLGMYAGYRPDSAALEVDHGALDPRLLGADLLGRPRADLHLRGQARLAAGGRARRDGDVFGRRMELSHPRTAEPPAAAGAQPRAVQARHDDPARPRRHARGDADRHGASSPARPASPNGRSCAGTCCG